jgi:hypothetical protein
VGDEVRDDVAEFDVLEPSLLIRALTTAMKRDQRQSFRLQTPDYAIGRGR